MAQRPANQLAALHAHLRGHAPAWLRLLRTLVERESPSHDKAAVDRLARYLAREWRRRGARVQLLRQSERGDLLRAELSFRQARGQLLVLGHLDTVYDRGTLPRMPFRLRRGRAYGPGAFDMKSGIVIGLAAVDALHALHLAPARKLVFLYTSDEEIGSAASRPIIEREARRSDAVLVLEPAAGAEGALKTARKGVAEYELIVHGRAAHAGLDPEKGVSATLELAHQIPRIVRLADSRRGLTVNVGVIAGGTRTNVVAAEARARFDVRAVRRADQQRVERRLQALRPVLRGARLELRRVSARPPLERTAQVVALFREAQRLARQLGVRLGETSVGGGSDGNLTAALGIPTLDGLGGVGAHAHSPNEYVQVSSLAERAALLAGLLLRL
ncbi:MAG: M20 family metallopeptidase [Terriglobia bacterium]